MEDNDVKIVNQRTREVLRLVWQNEDRPDYMNYMTLAGVKYSIRFSLIEHKVIILVTENF